MARKLVASHLVGFWERQQKRELRRRLYQKRSLSRKFPAYSMKRWMRKVA